ncbi:MAG TPA: glycosyltransferase [Solirubrobacterales bacterium]|nr:glycosyltransferase [Solirubrobacterales bacterium]
MRRKVCIAAADEAPAMRRWAELLAARHEVHLIEAPEAGEGIAALSFAGEDHRRSAAVLERIERAYGEDGPDLLLVGDRRAPGLVPLQARAAGHSSLRGTLVAVQLLATAELLALHDGRSSQPGEARAAELEREQLRLADRLVWPGGDSLDLYRRYYGDLRLPPAVRIAPAFTAPEPPQRPAPHDPSAPLRILYAGRLQRHEGVFDLVEACLRLPDDEWQLTLAGADTETASMGQSVRLTLEAMCGGDPRVRFEDEADLAGLAREHDLAAAPAGFAVGADPVLEAMAAGLPVLATPVGAQAEAVEPGVGGWLTEGTGTAAIERALTALLEDRDGVERVRRSGQAYESFLRLADPEPALDAFDELLAEVPSAGTAPAPAGAQEPLVTAVVPYYRAHRYVAEAVASLLAQTHANLRVVVVNDGSFEADDSVLEELELDPRVQVVHQLNRGDAIARNLGILLAEGEYLLMFDADNVLEPEFVSRALAMLQADPQLAYVTCWLRFVRADGEELEGRGYAPLGNRVVDGEEENWDGDTIALFPRRVLAGPAPTFDTEISMHADWLFYRRLRARGEFGAVIPERLARYRVHPDSLLRSTDERLHRRNWEEGRDRRRLADAQSVVER